MRFSFPTGFPAAAFLAVAFGAAAGGNAQSNLPESPHERPLVLQAVTAAPEHAAQPAPAALPGVRAGWGGAALPAAAPGAAAPEPYRAVDSDRNGSTLVPMDSWLYPALERLGALGLVPSQVTAIRPWTRQECRRQVREAEDLLDGVTGLEERMQQAERREAERMLPEMEAYLREPDVRTPLVLDSVYARAGTIAGPALTDSFHFGQTWWNDYGRPVGRGTSAIAGYTVRGTAGRFFFLNRQEVQRDPGLPAISTAQSALLNSLDNAIYPTAPPGFSLARPAVTAFTRTRPLALYAGIAFAGYNLSFGKQEIYWGPTVMGPFAFSRNAEPTYNLRLVASRPHPLPFVPEWGTYSVDLLFGKLSGHHYPARPYYNGQKFNLRLGRYLEMSATRWSLLFGQGHAMTLGHLKDNLISGTSTGTGAYGDPSDPGDRKSGFDFRLHVPGLKNLVTVYADSYADDDPNPLNAPRRNAWQPGIYLARLPWLPHIDLRFEMATTEALSQDEGNGRFLINNQYRDGNTNKGFLLGNAVGRDGRAFEGRIGYWATGRTHVEAGYRQNQASSRFLPGGGTTSDAFATATVQLSPTWTASAFVQHERFLIPSYLQGRQSNTSARIEVEWRPKQLLLFASHGGGQ